MNEPTKFLQVEKNEISADAPAGTASVGLNSNTVWSVTSDVDWLTVTPTSGKGPSVLSINWESMTNMDHRTGMITVQAGNLTQKINISQDQRIKLLGVQIILGNKETGVETNVVLTFNTNVKVESIHSASNTIENYSVNGAQVTFPISIELATEYPFRIFVQDGYIFDFLVSFHKAKLNIPGVIIDYLITDDNSSVWTITQNPNQLIKLSLPDLAYQASLPLEFKPERLTWNYFHGMLTVFDPAADDSSFRYVDPGDLKVRKVRVIPDAVFDPSYYPSDLCQMKNGDGILKTELIADFRWRYIDRNDSTWFGFDPRSAAAIGYEEIYLNYDHTKIIMRQRYGSTNLDIWQMGTDTLHTMHPPPITDANCCPNYITVNKEKDLIYHSNVWGQYVTDMNGIVSNISWIFGGEKFNSAFSYRSGEDQLIYHIVDNNFYVLDYQNAHVNLIASINPNFSRLQSTTDGKYLTGFVENNFFVFDLDALLANSTKYNPATGGRVSSIDNRSFWHHP